MKLIVGLGNRGEQYSETRHNLGFMVLDHFLQDALPVGQTKWEKHEKTNSDIAQFEWKPKIGPFEKVMLVKPRTYMNASGAAVGGLSALFAIAPQDIWVVHDDIDLQLGALRIRLGGSSGGHKGIASIMEHIGTDSFWRFRCGIGHPRRSEGEEKQFIKHVEDFVLEPFGQGESGKVRELITHTSKGLMAALEHGLDATMNSFNTR